MLLDTNAGSRYSLKDIDGYLLALDNDSMTEIPDSSVRGPFCMFPSLDQKENNDALRHTKVYTVADIEHSSNGNDAIFGSNTDAAAIDHGQHFTDNNPLTNVEWGEVLSKTRPLLLDTTSDIHELPLDEYDHHYDSENISTTKLSNFSIRSPSSDRSVTLTLNGLPMDRISTSLSNNPFIDMLMHHYITNVSDLLLPVRHPRNPYRNIYAPAALEVATGLTPTSGVNFALYNSLLASSAFHLWQCNPGLVNYYQIGSGYNEQAVHHLRSSISSTSVSTADYRNLLMTMLSLVDNSVSNLREILGICGQR
jgi:arginine metabolism regulation protein II